MILNEAFHAIGKFIENKNFLPRVKSSDRYEFISGGLDGMTFRKYSFRVKMKYSCQRSMQSLKVIPVKRAEHREYLDIAWFNFQSFLQQFDTVYVVISFFKKISWCGGKNSKLYRKRVAATRSFNVQEIKIKILSEFFYLQCMSLLYRGYSIL